MLFAYQLKFLSTLSMWMKKNSGPITQGTNTFFRRSVMLASCQRRNFLYLLDVWICWIIYWCHYFSVAMRIAHFFFDFNAGYICESLFWRIHCACVFLYVFLFLSSFSLYTHPISLVSVWYCLKHSHSPLNCKTINKMQMQIFHFPSTKSSSA